MTETVLLKAEVPFLYFSTTTRLQLFLQVRLQIAMQTMACVQQLSLKSQETLLTYYW